MANITLQSSDLDAIVRRFAPGIHASIRDGKLAVSNNDFAVELTSLPPLTDAIRIQAAGLTIGIHGLTVKNDAVELSAKISA